MMKTFIKGCFKLCLILILVIGCLFVTSTIMRPNKIVMPEDTTTKVDGFYALDENTLDVLLLGTSHTYFGFNPSILWKETGLSSYVFAGECQPIEITYHYLEEALKTQNPSLVILDLFGVSNTTESCKTEGIYRVNIEDLKLSRTKIKAYQELDNQSLLENIMDVSIYHDRLEDVTLDDFQRVFTRQFNNNFGFTLGFTYEKIVRDRELLEVNQMTKPTEEKWEAFLKIVELCKNKDIPLLLVKTPYYIEAEDAEIYEYVWEYADLNEIDYIDFNKLTKELNYVFDVDGDLWHANARGSKKLTDYLSMYLKENYSIESKTSVYDDAYNALYSKTEYALFNLENDLGQIISYINDMDVTVALSYREDIETVLTLEEMEILNTLGYNFSEHKGKNQLRILSNGIVINEKYSTEYEKIEFEINQYKVNMDTDGNILVDGQQINAPYSNLCVTLFDNETGYPVDTFYINDSTGNFEAQRK